jgi:hypothetical protein
VPVTYVGGVYDSVGITLSAPGGPEFFELGDRLGVRASKPWSLTDTL